MRESLSERKSRHLDMCLDRTMPVEQGRTGLERIGLYHSALPESSPEEVDLTTSFLGYSLPLPLLISPMTGGSGKGRHLNRILAQSAEKYGMAMSTGSIRIMLENPDFKSHFMLKEVAPGVPVLANIGAAQLGGYPVRTVLEAVKSIDADGLCVHLNAAQELFQAGGDSDFRGWSRDIEALIRAADFPVLVKETGSGIPPAEGLKLLEMGAAAVDLAGSGGTDWVAVETLKAGRKLSEAECFYGWGYPTALLLLAYRSIMRTDKAAGEKLRGRIIASGGLRTPMDFALALACGAWLGAAALPFIRAAEQGGMEGVGQYVETLRTGIIRAVVLSGAKNLETFRRSELRVPEDLRNEARALAFGTAQTTQTAQTAKAVAESAATTGQHA